MLAELFGGAGRVNDGHGLPDQSGGIAQPVARAWLGGCAAEPAAKRAGDALDLRGVVGGLVGVRGAGHVQGDALRERHGSGLLHDLGGVPRFLRGCFLLLRCGRRVLAHSLRKLVDVRGVDFCGLVDALCFQLVTGRGVLDGGGPLAGAGPDSAVPLADGVDDLGDSLAGGIVSEPLHDSGDGLGGGPAAGFAVDVYHGFDVRAGGLDLLAAGGDLGCIHFHIVFSFLVWACGRVVD